jgi:hypothetical protein
MEPRPEDGVAGFIADLSEWGVEASEVEGFVTYSVRAPGGALAGTSVQTAVAASELLAWPGVPPHWVHFRESVHLAQAHPDQSETQPGWIRHSRQFNGWERVTEPGRAWLAHVRFVVGEATQ